MLRYAITNRRLLKDGGDAAETLAAQAAKWAAAGMEWVQLREKDLGAGELERVAGAMVAAIRAAGGGTKLLVNGRADVAMAAGAHGVHLTAQPGELTVTQVRRLWPQAAVSVACHTLQEVTVAKDAAATLAVFGPVFEKPLPVLDRWLRGESSLPGVGVERLAEACRAAGAMPVYALGGVTLENAEDCLAAGAAGVAGIRLFL